jgi:Family of unknown function (DUF5906)
MALKSEAITAYLKIKTHADLAAMYHAGMEVQVNVAQGNGQRIDTGQLHGKTSFSFTDGDETWAAFRIPRKAMSEPENNDGPMMWNLEKHVDGIGLTGWDWKDKVSRWVAFDFDAMVGHADSHAKKLNDAQLSEVHKVVTELPYVTIRRSTSGKGLHVYILLEPVETKNHTEHAALARSILSYMAGVTGFNFSDKVDVCGGNTWIWHRKMVGTNGLTLIKQGELFKRDHVPSNWRDHLTVIARKSQRIIPKFGDESFAELSGQRAKAQLDEQHLTLIKWLTDRNYPGWWDGDNHMLVTHTFYLVKAHTELSMRGEFHTLSTGKDEGSDINCFMFPIKNGAWAIRRYGQGTQEHPLWSQDGKGWTKCFLNREMRLDDIARLYQAAETRTGSYQFPSCEVGKEALLKLGIDLVYAKWCEKRLLFVKEKEYKFSVQIPFCSGDIDTEMTGWTKDTKWWTKICNNPRYGAENDTATLGGYDDCIRHLVSENMDDCGWVVNTGAGWRYEPLQHVRLFLKSKGIGGKDIDYILGQGIASAWIIVNDPFQPEYPGDRKWNRSKAKFRIAPTLDGETLSFPTWNRVLNHCGSSLTQYIRNHAWCRANGITNGGEYLKLWFASLIQHPQKPLPYLAFHGPQDSGKSTIHEAFCQLILDGGYMDGALALGSQGNFNGELQDSILCTLEEVDLRSKGVSARLKDWVTSQQLSVHVKGQTPYKAPNYTHWIQCVNERPFIPVFTGDTRIVVIYVDTLSDADKIPKRDLWTLLTKEAPDYLAHLLSLDIPDSRDRLMLPVITTGDKEAAEYASMKEVERFVSERVTRVQGGLVKMETMFNAFKDWLGGEEQLHWTRTKFTKDFPDDIPKGRVSIMSPDQSVFYGNVSLDTDTAPSPRWISGGGANSFMRRDLARE